jgi:enoyl-CoA hydratase
MNSTELVLPEVRGHTGFILLNRPRAINALSYEMVLAVKSALDSWADEPAVRQVVIHGAGDRGFCAGGDVRFMYEDAVAGGGEGTRAFFEREYELDHLTSVYPKPYIAIMDGLTLGGGLGLTAHGGVRIVTERTRVGMPETGIGFLPDVGVTRLLANAPGELGTHLALTGETVDAAGALHIGLADWLVPSERLGDLLHDLEEHPVDEVLARFAENADGAAASSSLAQMRPWIDGAYAGDDPVEIVARLRAGGHEDVAELLEQRSPTAVCVALRAVRDAKELTLRETLDRDLRVAMRLFEHPDMREGIRAQVVDKDRNPRWNPSRLDQVDPGDIERIVA